MSTAKLEFRLPDEQAEFETAISAGRLAGLVADWQAYVRGKVKYSEDDDQATTWEHVFKAWGDFVAGANLPDGAI